MTLLETTHHENHEHHAITSLRPAMEPISLPIEMRGCRKIQSRSAISSRGVVVARLMGTSGLARIGYESSLERACLLIALAQHDTIDIVEQPFTLRYLDTEGKQRRYTFDYLITKRDGKRIAVEVKSSAQAEKPHVRSKIKAAASKLVPEYADEVFIFTERDYSRVQLENAEQIVNCAREIDPESDYQLRDVVDSLSGSVSISELIKLSKLAERGFPAVVRALRSNQLHWPQEQLIGPKMLVRRGESS